MKILVVSQYFWPENFKVNDVVLGLKEKGHDVTVFTGKPNYPTGKFYRGYSMFGRSKETWNGITIHRAALVPRGKGGFTGLFFNYLSFIIFSCWKALFTNIKPDAILVYQLSPVTMAIPAIVFKKKTGAPIYHYIQDLWPHSVIATNAIQNRFVIKQLNSLTQWIYKKADRILMQSRAFKDYLVTNKVDPGKLCYLPNSSELFYHKVDPPADLKGYFTGEMNLIFAGNIGDAQGFDTLIAAAKMVKSVDEKITWVILGEGRKKSEFEKKVLELDIADVFKFIGSFEPTMMPFFFAHADALIISLKKDEILSLTVPSKLQSYMSCAKPIIGSLDGEGQLIIRESGAGLAAPADDAAALAEAVLKFRKMTQDERDLMGTNSIEYFNKEFNRDMLLQKLVDIMEPRQRSI